MPDLRIGGKLEIADHNLVARAGEVDGARQGIQSGGNGCGYGDLIGRGVQQRRRQIAHRLVFSHPNVPIRAHQQPVFHVGVERGPHLVRKRAIGPAVEVGLSLQNREFLAQRLEILFHDPGSCRKNQGDELYAQSYKHAIMSGTPHRGAESQGHSLFDEVKPVGMTQIAAARTRIAGLSMMTPLRGLR